MRVVIAIACCLLLITVVAQAADTGWDEAVVTGPRLGLPSAHLLGERTVSAGWDFRSASHEGRKLNANQFELGVGITDRIEVGWDHHRVNMDGRTAGNTFDVTANGLQLRYGQDLFGAPGALFFQYRGASGRSVTVGGGTRIPPHATTFTLGAVRSAPWRGDNEWHVLGAVSRCKVGQQAWSLMGAAGADYKLWSGLSARGDLGLFKEAGDVSSFEVGVNGGLHYEHKCGLSADLMGTFLPSGTPVAGSPLGDASVFILDNVLGGVQLAKDIQNDAIGYYTVRVGYTTHF